MKTMIEETMARVKAVSSAGVKPLIITVLAAAASRTQPLNFSNF